MLEGLDKPAGCEIVMQRIISLGKWLKLHHLGHLSYRKA